MIDSGIVAGGAFERGCLVVQEPETTGRTHEKYGELEDPGQLIKAKS